MFQALRKTNLPFQWGKVWILPRLGVTEGRGKEAGQHLVGVHAHERVTVNQTQAIGGNNLPAHEGVIVNQTQATGGNIPTQEAQEEWHLPHDLQIQVITQQVRLDNTQIRWIIPAVTTALYLQYSHLHYQPWHVIKEQAQHQQVLYEPHQQVWHLHERLITTIMMVHLAVRKCMRVRKLMMISNNK